MTRKDKKANKAGKRAAMRALASESRVIRSQNASTNVFEQESQIQSASMSNTSIEAQRHTLRDANIFDADLASEDENDNFANPLAKASNVSPPPIQTLEERCEIRLLAVYVCIFVVLV